METEKPNTVEVKPDTKSKGMTSRERVLAAFRHRDPDRTPIDFSGHRSSGIAAIAYAKLRKHLGLPPKPLRVYDPVQQLAIVDPDVLDLFGVDVIELGRAFALDDECWADWVLPDGTPCQMPAWALPERGKNEWLMRSASGKVLARMPDGALYFEQCYFPLIEEGGPRTLTAAMDECMWTAVNSPPGPLAAGAEGLRRLADGARALRASTNRAIVGLFGGNLFEMGQFFYRNDNFLMLLAAEPTQVHDFLDWLVEIHLANLERFLGAVGDSIDVILFGDDLGMQTGPFISRKMYREFFKPRHSTMWNRAKQLANVKVMLHTCGGIRELLPDLIEAGLDAMNPVQTSCQGMDPAELKAEFGREMVFWGGGCDTQTVLPSATPEAVKKHVRERVRILAPGGGFVFQQVHNIMANVPPENVVAMFAAAREEIR
jgi:uroporphyrinogen decarboxylase